MRNFDKFLQIDRLGRLYKKLNNMLIGSNENARDENTDDLSVSKNNLYIERTKNVHTHFLNPQTLSQLKSRYADIDITGFTQMEIEAVQIYYHMIIISDSVALSIRKHITPERIEKNEVADGDALINIYSDKVQNLAAMVLNNFDIRRINVRRSREFSPITDLPMDLIADVIPLDLIEIDITAANPTFIDGVIDSNISQQVYQNVMDAEGIDRNAAKKMYNIHVNSINHQIPDSDRERKYIQWGYTKQQARQIVELSQESGQIYEQMTAIEEKVITEMKDAMGGNIRVIRRHDSLVVLGHQSVLEESLDLFEMLFNNELHVSYHINKYYK